MKMIATALDSIREVNIKARKILLKEIQENPPKGWEGLVVNTRIGLPAPNAPLYRELFYWVHITEKNDSIKVYWINLFAEVLDTQSGNLHTVPNVIQLCKNVKYQNGRYGLNLQADNRQWIIQSHRNTKLASLKVDDLLDNPAAAHQVLEEFLEFIGHK